MAAQKATKLRRLLTGVEATGKALLVDKTNWNLTSLAVPAANWREALTIHQETRKLPRVLQEELRHEFN